MPIQSVRHEGLWLLYEEDDARGVPEGLADRLRDMLIALATARVIGEVGAMPGWELYLLKGDPTERWSLTVAHNCWLTFRFESGDAFDLDLAEKL